MRATLVTVLLAALVAGLAGAPEGASAKGPSVRGELTRLERRGAIDAATAHRYRASWTAAQKTLRRLHGARRGELRAVLANVDAIAASRRLSASRLPSLMLTVARNRAWWAGAPFPASGQRTQFSGSQLVWQYYPGQGWQIQWLGTFGRANGLWMMKTKDRELRALLDEAIGLAAKRAGGLAFEYLFRFNGGRPPWVSGLAQGTGLSALARAAVRLKDPKYFRAARSALGIFRTPPPSGIRVRTDAGAHYLQYSYAPRLRILNGFVQSLNGLHDFAVLANDDRGRALFDAGEAELRRELPRFDTGAWSLYSRVSGGGRGGVGGPESDLGYHKLVRDFLRGLCDRLESDRERRAAAPAPEAVSETGGATPTPAPPSGSAEKTTRRSPSPARYCHAADRFTKDLRTPPALEVEGRTLRAKRTGSLRFELSKVSTVAVTVRRGGKLVLARTLRLGRGRHALALKPAKAGPLAVALRAVDLAGNVGTAHATLHVRPAPKRH